MISRVHTRARKQLVRCFRGGIPQLGRYGVRWLGGCCIDRVCHSIELDAAWFECDVTAQGASGLGRARL